MSDIGDRYRRLADRFTSIVEAVPDDAWDAPSPCEEWNARQVFQHVVDTEHEFLDRFGLALAASGDHPADRWPPVRAAVQRALDDPATAGTTYEGWFGETTFAETIDGFYSPDLVVHGWDIARASGLRHLEPMPDDEIARIHERLGSLGDAIRSPGAFGPPVPVPDGASAQDHLLGFLGRRP